MFQTHVAYEVVGCDAQHETGFLVKVGTAHANVGSQQVDSVVSIVNMFLNGFQQFRGELSLINIGSHFGCVDIHCLCKLVASLIAEFKEAVYLLLVVVLHLLTTFL